MSTETADAALVAIMRELEETMEKANLLALELALKELEEGRGDDAVSDASDAIGNLAGCAAQTTEQIERLVRRMKAA